MNPLLNTPNGTTFNGIIFFVLTNCYGHPHSETLCRLSFVLMCLDFVSLIFLIIRVRNALELFIDN